MGCLLWSSQAPNFILPETHTGQCEQCVVLAMGTFALQTELDPDRRRRIAAETYGERDHYDHYTLRITKVRVFSADTKRLLATPDITAVAGAGFPLLCWQRARPDQDTKDLIY
jgi:hypothetical protein